MRARLYFCLTLTFVAILIAGCSSSSSANAPSTPAPTFAASVAPGFLTFPSTTIGSPSATQTVTLTNTGSGVLTVTGLTTTGPNAADFTEPPPGCTTLNPGATCVATITFFPTGSGAATAILGFVSNAAGSPQTITLTGTGTAIATAANTVDCSANTGFCPPTFSTGGQLATDPIAASLFHGYADPSIRKDPNSSNIYMAYSWAHNLSDGTHVVDLHLASSSTGGNSFTYVGPLYQSAQTTQTVSTAYSSINDSSTETIDLLPIPLTGASSGQTLWIQAHQSYLVKPQAGIYDQLNATNEISVTAVQLANPSSAGSGIALLALGYASTPEARLGAAGTDPSRNATQSLYGLAAASQKCANWGQPTLWYQSGTLYLALECSEAAGNGNIDTHELSHFLYSTSPTGSDASKWTWAYVGEFLTGADAAKLGTTTAENAAYQFFTEPQFVQTKSGQLTILATPGIFAPVTSQQPVIQYGCRVIPITLTPTSIAIQRDTTTGAPVVIARVTENDLYTTPNEGPAACTYEPASNNGIIMGRKFENDPTYGFYLYPLNSEIAP